ncbi:NucA/NucB deoxyribonuclease domain-containing protein [Streptomyces sp. NPDC050145]|uniref:NucA/NucB deoxyribonuclease domain-containing protein n=1 Tax=Streptomyces sp. NPDC050145 TaxID=3365602 RepID=UPI0037957A9E
MTKERLAYLQNRTQGVSAQLAVDPTDCQQLESAKRDIGLVIDHFTWCKVSDHRVWVKECNSWGICQETGSATFRLSTVGMGKNGSRDIEFVSLMDQISIVGTAATEPVTLDIACTATNGSACNGDALNRQTYPMAEWKATPSAYFHFSSPEAGAVGADLISWYDFEGSVKVRSASDSFGKNTFRCDSSTYIAQSKGCVFDSTIELWYDLSVSDSTVNESAQHILDAQYRPELTVPTWSGKTVPGAIDSAQPLNRAYHDTSLRDANRRKAISTCKLYYGSDYATRGLDCDEYPFASTLQGAAAGDNRYSARALDSADNQTAGRRLGQFYDRQRVLDNDPFFVIVLQ